MLLKAASLSPEHRYVLQKKGTEQPFSGEYDNFGETGTYLCRQCGLALFRSDHKFHSGCGWASFEDEIPGTVKHQTDADGQRTEILCARCDGHLGHIFHGEQLTAKNARYCVNSLSLDFVNDLRVTDTEETIFAGGCFWGVESLFQTFPGVVKTEVGYIGGHKDYPSYDDVCSNQTGHREALRIVYNPEITSYEKIARHFFEIHDPTQASGQGPDLGEQYQSAVYCYDSTQETTIKKLLKLLAEKNYSAVTQILPMAIFWRAEEYHQRYYQKTGHAPYCHRYVKRFD